MAAMEIDTMDTEEDTKKQNHPFALKKEDAMDFVICGVHEGSTMVNFQACAYVMKKRQLDGVSIIDITKAWDKLYLAARIIASAEHWPDVCVVSNNNVAKRATLKFAAHTGSSSIVGRFTPGTLTNQSQKNFKEPRLLIISDPAIDTQAIREASHVNVPVIALCNTNSPMQYVDVAIPCNNKNPKSVGLIFWMLAREVLHLRGQIDKAKGFVIGEGKERVKIMPDLYFYREHEEAEDEEEEGKPVPHRQPQHAVPYQQFDPTTVIDAVLREMEVEKSPEYKEATPEEPKVDLRMGRIVDWAADSK